MFKYKTTEELEKMDATQLDAYKTELQKHESDLRAKEISEAVEAVKTELTAEIKKANDANVALENQIKELKDAQVKEADNEVSFKKEFESKKEAIKNIVSGQRGELTIKAITNRASISGNTNAYVLPTIGQLGVKARALYDVLPKISISDRSNDNGIIKYHDWDEDTIARATAMVAEGGTFPESTAKFIERTIPIRKIGDTLVVTEEFEEDSAQASAELERFLDVNVNTFIDAQIINGAGTGETLTGLLASTPDYTPVASGIAGANIKDLVRKMRTAIVKGRGSKYSPDIVVMNSDTFDRYYLAKDLDNNYLFDTANGTIAGLFVVEDNNMPDNQLVVGDRRFATIYEKSGIVLSEGTVNAQFTSDSKTIKARKRMAMLIRVVDQTGFLHCTNVTTALTTLAS
jgi:HK97 family phage major capsid protein